MNVRSIESQIVQAKAYNDTAALIAIQQQLSTSIIKMDRWFDKYLDMFSDKLSTVEKTDPIRKLYDAKYAEYSKLTHLVRVTKAYMVK